MSNAVFTAAPRLGLRVGVANLKFKFKLILLFYHHRRPGAGMTPSQTLPVSASMTDPGPGAGGRRGFKLVVLIIVLLHAT